MNLSPRYLANIENKGQQPSLQIFYELVTRYSISVDQFFFPNKDAEKNTQRRQLDVLLDSMSNDGLEIVTATAQKVVEVEKNTKQLRRIITTQITSVIVVDNRPRQPHLVHRPIPLIVEI